MKTFAMNARFRQQWKSTKLKSGYVYKTSASFSKFNQISSQRSPKYDSALQTSKVK